ncbi:MAG: VPLPA-CTERM sorting domain-containing protein [Chromatiales bacterium]|nr:VPLPA-CTERM sorting domain-containing protein [Chromatiales bacterium]
MKSSSVLLRRSLVAVTLVLASVAANAASVTFNNVANSVNRGGVYSGYYSLTIDSMSILGLCDSVNSQVNPPVTWTADILTYADIQAGLIGKFNNPPNPITKSNYSKAGWLFSQLGTLAPNDYSGQADIQEAIWKIMSPAYVLVGAGASAWYTAAAAQGAFDWTNVMRVVTPNPLVQDGIDVQEFLIGPAIAVVPVPAAVWLFGSALGIMGWVRRKTTA